MLFKGIGTALVLLVKLSLPSLNQDVHKTTKLSTFQLNANYWKKSEKNIYIFSQKTLFDNLHNLSAYSLEYFSLCSLTPKVESICCFSYFSCQSTVGISSRNVFSFSLQKYEQMRHKCKVCNLTFLSLKYYQRHQLMPAHVLVSYPLISIDSAIDVIRPRTIIWLAPYYQSLDRRVFESYASCYNVLWHKTLSKRNVG